jgi:hypothetical protein
MLRDLCAVGSSDPVSECLNVAKRMSDIWGAQFEEPVANVSAIIVNPDFTEGAKNAIP